jgi:hypothetical protein
VVYKYKVMKFWEFISLTLFHFYHDTPYFVHMQGIFLNTSYDLNYGGFYAEKNKD